VNEHERERWAEVRRPFDRLETRIVELWLAKRHVAARPTLDALRYCLSFAKLTLVRNASGQDVDVGAVLSEHRRWVQDVVAPRLERVDSVETAGRELPELARRTRDQRRTVLAQLPLDRASLDAEVGTRLLVVASGGGGGAGYVYPGAYELLERSGLCPDLMVGTSIGALMSVFRARLRRYDFVPLVAAARRLSWGGVFQVLETSNRYGLPATLRLRLRTALGSLLVGPEGRPLRIMDCEIPLVIVATGITVDALKHDLNYYEHLLDDDVRRSGVGAGLRGTVKVLQILREFFARKDALKVVALGRDPGTEAFDVLDAAGFSSSVPGVIHYDVLRDDPLVHRLLDQLYAEHGITRLGEGGLVSNVPARVGWETAVSGRLGRRNAFVLALDCFAPHPRRLAWVPFQQAVRTANVNADRAFADVYLPYVRTLSPLNMVPSIRDALTATRWGSEELAPRLPLIQLMCEPVPSLADED
jgi:predicted acylesterase/phospholipase RssA